jgi:hypothetical protein
MLRSFFVIDHLSGSELIDFEIDSYLISGTGLGLGVVCQLELQPRFESAGIACERNVFAVIADSTVAVALAYRFIALLVCVNSRRAALTRVLRLSVRPTMPFMFFVTSLKIACLFVIHGPFCGLFELCYSYLILGAIVIGPVACKTFRSWGPIGGRGRRTVQDVPVTLGAEAKATRVLAGLRAFVYADTELENGLDSKAQCSICLDEFEPLDLSLVTPCGHSFHEHCLRRWLTHQAYKTSGLSCALCRQRLSEPLVQQPAFSDSNETPPPRLRRIFLDDR